MPIYEYVCPKCKNKVETISSGSEIKCPKCGTKMNKIISAPSLIYVKG